MFLGDFFGTALTAPQDPEVGGFFGVTVRPSELSGMKLFRGFSGRCLVAIDIL